MVKLFGGFEGWDIVQLLLITFIVMAALWVGIEWLVQMRMVLVLAVGALVIYWLGSRKKGKKTLLDSLI